MAPVAETERRGHGLVELQAKSVSGLGRVILAIAPELHPLKQSRRTCQHRDASQPLEPVVPAFPAYLICQEFRIRAATLAPMPPRTKRRGADNARRELADL